MPWDSAFEATPANSEDRSLGAQRIRETRSETRTRAAKELIWGPGSTDTGDLMQGACKVFYRDTNPAVRNSAATPTGGGGAALGAGDAGRLMARTDLTGHGHNILVWTGAAWEACFQHTPGNNSTADATQINSTALTTLQKAAADWEFGPGLLPTVDSWLVRMYVSTYVRALGAAREIGVRLEFSANGGGVWNLHDEAIVSAAQNDTIRVVFNYETVHVAASNVLWRIRGATHAGGAASGEFNTANNVPFGSGTLTSRARWNWTAA